MPDDLASDPLHSQYLALGESHGRGLVSCRIQEFEGGQTEGPKHAFCLLYQAEALVWVMYDPIVNQFMADKKH